MSGVSRQKTLLEQAISSNLGGTNEQVKSQLEIVDFDPSTIEGQITDLENDLGIVETDLGNLETTVANVSGNLSIDIENLDTSLTQKIVEDVVQSEGVTGSETTLTGSLTVTINGVEYKLGVVE